MALPLLALVVAGGCSGTDSTTPISSDAKAVSSASPSALRGGAFHAVKECTGFTGASGSFCEFSESNVKAIPKGSRFYYQDPPLNVFSPAGTDVILDVPGPGNNQAFGHCAMNLATSVGLCAFSGGTGKFTHFHASLVVSNPQGLSWDLNGSYSYSP